MLKYFILASLTGVVIASRMLSLPHDTTVPGNCLPTDRARVLRPWSQVVPGRRPMCQAPSLPSVGSMTDSPLAIVTGASRGLGHALAAGLASAGYRLIIDARDGEALRAAAAALRASHDLPPASVLALPGDIADCGHRADLAAAASAAGGPALLVNNAGTLGASPLPALADYPVAALRTALEINLVAPLAITQLLLPALREAGGSVLTITSDAAVEAYAGWGGYGAAKAGLEQACHVLAAEEPAVRFWWVDPGDLRTALHQQAFPGSDISDRPEPETVIPAFLRLIRERMPSGRYQAAELMPAVATAAAPAGPAPAGPAPAGPAPAGPAPAGPEASW